MAEILVLNAADRDVPRGYVFAVKQDGFAWGSGEHLTHEDCSFLVVRVDDAPLDDGFALMGWIMDIDAHVDVQALAATPEWEVPTVLLSAFTVPPEQAPTVEGA
ncbi:MAG TPA: hypothetical protein VE028_03945 [Nitratidesulfovibrio sp.]|nr:hypothetical protein [Nitratidesulfovibrio sp.]